MVNTIYSEKARHISSCPRQAPCLQNGTKFGIKIPTNAEHEYKVDTNNVNTFWQDVIQTKMQINGITFKVLREGECSPHGWHKVKRHIVVGVNMDVNRKARRILDGHKTSDPI